MVALMGGIEMVVAGEDSLLDVRFYFLLYHHFYVM
jgi:hypothetical protein